MTSRGDRRGSIFLDERDREAWLEVLRTVCDDGHRLKTTAADGSTITISVYSPAGQLLYVTQRGGPRPPATTQYIYLHRHQVAEVKR